MKIRRRIPLTLVSATLAVAVSAPLATNVSAATTPKVTPISINVAAGSYSMSNSILFNAYAGGYFRKYGLNVTINIVAAALVPAALAAGQDLMYFASLGPAFVLPPQGIPTSIIFGEIGGGAGAWVGAEPSVTSLKQCTTMAASAPGTGIYGDAVVLRKLFGLSYSILSVGTPALQDAAVQAGTANCTIDDEPDINPAATGLHVIFDPKSTADIKALGKGNVTVPIPLEGVALGIKANLRANRTAVNRFNEALYASLQNIKSNRKNSATIVLREQGAFPALASQSTASLVSQYNITYPFWGPQNGAITRGEWGKVLFYMTLAGTYPTNTDSSSPLFTFANMIDESYYNTAVKAYAKTQKKS